ncbi:MAG: hypothetical protein SAJ12_12660 [Jaaginema sp. PMC 1079.18]|nr:hypothetical protein [Jaaginema sp. PMC 1080.18]MEC4851856.1 hypothetical protein [Jaaginema sp. PMC 1079.18]MEC4867676.1 hypothetical protein [Jaaginema sp. PMC 1078.18]
MSTSNQARALMMRHNRLVRNRQATMLNRAAAEVGLDVDSVQYRSHIQGKSNSGFRVSYDRSNAAMS